MSHPRLRYHGPMTLSRCVSHPTVAIAMLILAGAPQPEPPEGELQEASCAVIGDRVFFDIGSTELRPDAMDTIGRAVEYLTIYPAEIVLEGHTDSHFPEEEIPDLGWWRAEFVRDEFIARGYPAEYLHTVSYGNQRPAVLGDNAAAWAQNRRVVFVIKRRLVDPPESTC